MRCTIPTPKKGQSKEDFISENVSSRSNETISRRQTTCCNCRELWKKHQENPKKKHEMGGIGEFPSGSSAYVPELIKKKDAERKYKR